MPTLRVPTAATPVPTSRAPTTRIVDARARKYISALLNLLTYLLLLAFPGSHLLSKLLHVPTDAARKYSEQQKAALGTFYIVCLLCAYRT